MATAQAPAHTENFKSHNIRFLQEQNRQVLSALEKVEEERDDTLQVIKQWEDKQVVAQREYAKLNTQLGQFEDRCNASRMEILKKDEQIRVLSEQNTQLMSLLEQEESRAKAKINEWTDLKNENDRLQSISDEYDRMKAAGDQQMLGANTEILKMQEELRNATNETEQLQSAAKNFAAQAKVDIESLEDTLAQAKQKNVGYLQQIQHNEVNEHRLAETVQGLKDIFEDLTVQKKSLRMQLDGDQAQRDKWCKSRAEVTRRLETLEATRTQLRAALDAAEQANTQMQQENQSGAENFRQMGDKVYALMDQLRLNQVDLKKQEQAGKDKQKRIEGLDKQLQSLQGKLSIEVDAKLAAEAEARSAGQMQALLQKKHKKLNEAMTLALRSQEKTEKRQQELTDKGNALTTQNAYLASRVDGQEEDKAALKAEMRKLQDDLRHSTQSHQQLAVQHANLEDEVNVLDGEKAALNAEIEYIKREDMLDDTGRTKPILIESNESKLVERLQINEFLYSAQQARNPVPMLIEKVSHLLELLHTAQTQSDQYLQDLQRSNNMLTALRQKNMSLYERTQLCETWKMRALLKIVSNEFELRPVPAGLHNRVMLGGGNTLYLDGLQYTSKELVELQRLITNYNKQESVVKIRLQENSLSDESVEGLIQIISLCPYLNALDLKGNRIGDAGMERLQAHLELIPGVTNVMRDPKTKDLRARSGNQVRLSIVLEDQLPPSDGPASGTMNLTPDLSCNAADDFLNSAAGITTQQQLLGPEASITQMPSMQMSSVGGVGTSSSSAPGAAYQGDMTRQPAQTQQFPARTVMPAQQSALPEQLHATGSSYDPGAPLPDGIGKFGGVPIGLGGAGEVSRLGPRGSSDSTLPRIASDTQLSGRSGQRPSSATRRSKAQPR